MVVAEAIEFIRSAVDPGSGDWADLGAGTGTFTLALCELMNGGRVYAVDKSPHVLWTLESPSQTEIQVVDGDFSRSMDIPVVKNILMANALHYASDHGETLKQILEYLEPGGKFVLIEYETVSPNRWVPYPITFSAFGRLCQEVGLTEPVRTAMRPTLYGHQHMYAAVSFKMMDD